LIQKYDSSLTGTLIFEDFLFLIEDVSVKLKQKVAKAIEFYARNSVKKFI
jgi:hypothetical protein